MSQFKSLWTLDPNITYLNHGSYGATPRKIIEEQKKWIDVLETEPCQYFRELPMRLRGVREKLAKFVGADVEGMVLFNNATLGANTILNSLRLKAGDEIIVSNHGYLAVEASCRALALQVGVEIRMAQIPYPLKSHDDIVKAFEPHFSKRTRLMIVDHITSPSALVFPVEKLVALAKLNKVPIFIDGAHGPGMIPLDLEKLGADFYVGNLHKWMCAPKGTAFMSVAKEHRATMHPLSTSYFYGLGFEKEFEWTGTDDASPLLCLPSVIEFHNSFGPGKLAQMNHELMARGAKVLNERLGWELPHPDSSDFYGSMAGFVMPVKGAVEQAKRLKFISHFYEKHKIELQCQPVGNCHVLRISAQAYNNLEDFEKLAAALSKKDYMSIF